MTDNLERALGRVEGRITSFEGKIDGLISSLSAAEVRAENSREKINARLDETEERILAVQDELHAVSCKVDAIEPRIADIEPEIKELRRLRIQGITVIATLTFIGSLLGVTLFTIKDQALDFMRRIFGG